jgi:hypothetical protein
MAHDHALETNAFTSRGRFLKIDAVFLGSQVLILIVRETLRSSLIFHLQGQS